MPAERRSRTERLTVERRAEPDDAAPPARIVGHAAVYDQWTTLYEGRYWVWREILRPGAFRRAIAEKQDVRSLFNHDENFVLGRSIAGTLELEEDETGLLTRTAVPDTQTIRDLVVAPIERGDVSGMSFAFAVPRGGEVVQTERPDGTEIIETPYERTTFRYEGDRLIEERELLDLDLYDVSPVTFPAYAGTDVAARSRPDVAELIAAKDRPHRRRAPVRDELRRWLDQSAIAGRADGADSAAARPK